MLKEEVLSMLLNAQEPVSGEGICKTLGVTPRRRLEDHRPAAAGGLWDRRRAEARLYARVRSRPARYGPCACSPVRPSVADAGDSRAQRGFHEQRLQAPCRRGSADGTAILTGCQTAGRGRRGRTFISPPGGLYFSVILRPHAKPEALMHLTAMAAVAAARAVFAVSGVYPDIKWTNDLVLGGKKLCGILTEIGIEAESREVDYAVVGIGINCARVDLPPEVSAMSASLEAFTGQKPDRARLAAALVRSLCELEQALFTEKDAWLREFAAHCITIGQDVKLVRGDDVTYAHADGIDEEAALLVTYPTRQKPPSPPEKSPCAVCTGMRSVS